MSAAANRTSSTTAPIYRGPLPHVTTVERLPVTVYDQPADASRAVAREIADLVRERAAAGKKTVLGLATGSTPVGVYDELIRLHREEGVSFKTVVTFNLDEYWPIQPDALQSYHRFMREHLFDHIDIPADAINIPDGTLSRDQISAACMAYEEKIREAGGIDLQVLGIGRTGGRRSRWAWGRSLARAASSCSGSASTKPRSSARRWKSRRAAMSPRALCKGTPTPGLSSIELLRPGFRGLRHRG
jgi:hypothetical protein